ncbi:MULTISPECIES: DUF1236 domain-containing protein [Chelatococcus]|uniref:DUF1236 domain-containing protein n=1 Tax=Chelatococcus caeni TaxID=1348468 RepID=A0A840C0S9_9HYPH|nr:MULTISPECIES: DUF1236 domain-containing protein [Chelatococcus]ALA18879.1 hypothetical protein AL346_17555 [Chelatococcus sp. CO-6]MBB4016107.1 hypothetical protein [Chelatococcus caeni]
MRKVLLTTVAALALGLGPVYAQAQRPLPEGGGDTGSPQSGPGTGGSGGTVAPGGSGASGPAMKRQPGAGSVQPPSAAGEGVRGEAQERRQGAPRMEGQRTPGAGEQPSRAERQQRPGSAQGGVQMDEQDRARQGADIKQRDDTRGAVRERGTTDAPSGSAGTRGSDTDVDTTGSVGTNVEISTEHRRTIRETITSERVEPVRDVNFTISVGQAIPRTVELHPLPPRVVEIVPQYREYVYFVLADGRIVIVDPRSYEIVYIVTA